MSGAARRRVEMVERLDREREAVAEAFGAVRGRMRVAETLVGAVQRANRHRVLSGMLAVAAIVAPIAARSWLKRAAWFLPLAVAAIRVVRNARDDRDDGDEPTD